MNSLSLITIVITIVITMKTTAKITRIGNSKGVRIASKDLAALGLDVGDQVVIHITNKKQSDNVASAADEILKRYNTAFKNLAKR